MASSETDDPPYHGRGPLACLRRLLSAGYSTNIIPAEQIMEGRKGEKSRALKVYGAETRLLARWRRPSGGRGGAGSARTRRGRRAGAPR
jgi:hypothetical protein